MKISVIIRFRNEGKFLEEFVENLIKQEGDYSYELIFVDNQSTDESIDYVQKIKKAPPAHTSIKLLHIENFTYASALNLAIPEITGEHTLVVSPDIEIVDKNALNAMVKNFSDNEVVAVYPRILPRDVTTFSHRIAVFEILSGSECLMRARGS